MADQSLSSSEMDTSGGSAGMGKRIAGNSPPRPGSRTPRPSGTLGARVNEGGGGAAGRGRDNDDSSVAFTYPGRVRHSSSSSNGSDESGDGNAIAVRLPRGSPNTTYGEEGEEDADGEVGFLHEFPRGKAS